MTISPSNIHELRTLLLQPAPGDDPAGLDVLEDATAEDLRWRVRAARDVERRLAEGHEPSDPLTDWETEIHGDSNPETEHRRAALMLRSTKHLEFALWVTEAWTHTLGYRGFAEGLLLLDGLIERYGRTLHPRDPARLAKLLRSIGAGDPVVDPLARALSQVPMGPPPGTFTYLDLRRVREGAAARGPLGYLGEPPRDEETMRQLFRDADEPWKQRTQSDIAHAHAAARSLAQRVDEHLSDVAALSMKSLLGLVSDLEREMQLLSGRDASNDKWLASPEPGQLVEVPLAAASSAESIRSRREAIQLIRSVARYLESTEPQSPVSALLHQAADWADTPFRTLWANITHDDDTRRAITWLVSKKEDKL